MTGSATGKGLASHIAAPYYDGRLPDGRVIGMSDVCRAWRLGRELSNAVKYLLRAGKKGPAAEDYGKAADYLSAALDLHLIHGDGALLVGLQVGDVLAAPVVAAAFGVSGPAVSALCFIELYGDPWVGGAEILLASALARVQECQEGAA